jgi:hypothetical protein
MELSSLLIIKSSSWSSSERDLAAYPERLILTKENMSWPLCCQMYLISNCYSGCQHMLSDPAAPAPQTIPHMTAKQKEQVYIF